MHYQIAAWMLKLKDEDATSFDKIAVAAMKEFPKATLNDINKAADDVIALQKKC